MTPWDSAHIYDGCIKHKVSVHRVRMHVTTVNVCDIHRVSHHDVCDTLLRIAFRFSHINSISSHLCSVQSPSHIMSVTGSIMIVTYLEDIAFIVSAIRCV